MDKSEKLNKLLEILKTDTVTPKEIEQFLTTVVGVIKSSKERFESISAETIREVQSALEYIENEHELMLSKVENLTQKQSDEFKSKLSEVNSILATIKQLKDGNDGRDGIDGEKGEKGDKGEDGSPDTGEDIVAKINSLELSPEFQIDASHIKNLPEPTSGGRLGSTARNLWQLNDVTLSSPTNGQALVYNSTTRQWENGSGGSGTPGGSDTQVQFNDGGSFGGNAGLTYDKTLKELSLNSTDEVNGTARINLYSYEGLGSGDLIAGEVIRLFSMADDSKQALAWYDNFTTPGTPIVKAWLNWHYKSNNSYEGNYIHDHISIETPMADGSISSRFEVQTANADTTGVNTFNANFTVYSGINGTTGSDGNTKRFGIYTGAGLTDFNQRQIYNTSTYQFGMADTAGQYAKICQSFTAGQQRYTGVKFWKLADTGTFTGTVTVSLYLNVGFLPSGSPLGTVTYSNSEWLALAVGQNTATFTSQVNGLTVGNSYSFVFETSTNDNSNHPNIAGVNSSKYAGGTAKVYNSTDGWTNITADLYFIPTVPSSGSTRDKSIRWYMRGSSDVEANLADGTNFELTAYDNTGTAIGTYLTANRSTGNIGIGNTSPSARLHVTSTTEQLRLGYDSTYYTGLTVSSAGNLTIDPYGGVLILDASLRASTSAGLTFQSNSGTDVALFGAGGGAAVTFYDGVKLNASTASRILSTDSSKNITALDTATYPDLTELSYVKGVTSAIQTQINTIVNAMTVIAQPDVGNSAGGADTTVYSFTVPANTIDGTRFKGIRVNLSAALSSTSETTTFKIKLNGVTCSTQSTANTNASLVWYDFIVRSTSSTARSFGDRITTASGTAADANNSISGLDFTASQTFAITIASTTANRGTLSNLIVEYI